MNKNQKFRVLIVDDESYVRFILKSLLEELENVEIVGDASNFTVL